MNQKEQMLAGLPYKAWMDGLEGGAGRPAGKSCTGSICCRRRSGSRVPALLKEIFGKTGERVFAEAPLHCDYGANIEVGENFFANYNLTILDVAKVVIGKNAMIAPNVSIYTAGASPSSRQPKYGI